MAFNTGSCDIGIATGIDELSVESINIYPNPGYDQITLELPEMSRQTTIRITDAMGKIIMQKQVDTTKQVLDVSRLNPGLYEISITNKNKAGIGLVPLLLIRKLPAHKGLHGLILCQSQNVVKMGCLPVAIFGTLPEFAFIITRKNRVIFCDWCIKIAPSLVQFIRTNGNGHFDFINWPFIATPRYNHK